MPMDKRIVNRAAIKKGKEFLLVAQFGQTYRDQLAELIDTAEYSMAWYYFMFLFEWGHHGVNHLSVNELRIGEEIKGDSLWPIAAVLIGLRPASYILSFEKKTGHQLMLHEVEG